jgi:uncharacterized protein (TIGR03435 family)
MKRALVLTILTSIVCARAYGQSRESTDTFEIADVHVSPRSTTPLMRTSIRSGRYELHNAAMVDLIRTAYGIDADKVLGGPTWLEYDRFDVFAKIPAKVPPPDALKQMLQSLLADRFKLVVHKDSKPVAGFVLSSGKSKPKLKEADAAGETGCKRQPPPAPTPGVPTVPLTTYTCRNMTMEAFAAALRGMAPDYVGNAVVDSTGLKGSWDFDIKWTSRFVFQLSAAGAGDAVSLPDAIDKQLGLKLEEQKIPTPVIVVDDVNEKPTDNSPDLARAFPPAPPLEFEVADIKPSNPNAGFPQGVVLGVLPGGRANLPRFPLTLAITLAWNISNDDIIGAPKWLTSTPFDIVAKLPEGAIPGNGTVVPLQEIGPALQALLIDRFKMKFHFEDRPVNAYTLVAAKPKLKKADPVARTGCKTANAPAAAGTTGTPFGILSANRVVTCQNMTMAQFADQLQFLAGPYVHYPVLDGTALEGPWDFSFTYAAIPPAQLAGLRGAPPPGAVTENAVAASDPTGGTTLFDALEKQLGLKLEMQKRPYRQFVIDHMEDKPTDN